MGVVAVALVPRKLPLSSVRSLVAFALHFHELCREARRRECSLFSCARVRVCIYVCLRLRSCLLVFFRTRFVLLFRTRAFRECRVVGEKGFVMFLFIFTQFSFILFGAVHVGFALVFLANLCVVNGRGAICGRRYLYIYIRTRLVISTAFFWLCSLSSF